jgi:hypothetical protein
MKRRWVSISEAATYFDIPAKTLYSLAARGLLPKGAILRLGRQLRVDIEAVEKQPAEKARK